MEAKMANTVVILMRVFFGLALGFVGLIVLGQGFIMVAHVDFPTWGLAMAMLAGMAAGSAILFGACKLLSSTLKMPKQAAL
jgi:hypothetical protein